MKLQDLAPDGDTPDLAIGDVSKAQLPPGLVRVPVAVGLLRIPWRCRITPPKGRVNLCGRIDLDETFWLTIWSYSFEPQLSGFQSC